MRYIITLLKSVVDFFRTPERLGIHYHQSRYPKSKFKESIEEIEYYIRQHATYAEWKAYLQGKADGKKK